MVLIGVNEAGSRIGRAPDTIRKQCQNGALVCVKGPNGRWLIDTDEIDRYGREQTYGHPHSVRFWRKVDRTAYCWNWTGALNKGYGAFNLGSHGVGPTIGAHRFAYEELVGKVPAGLDLDHLCRNRRCVRPEHLSPVTRQVNLLRGETIPAANVSKTHCPQGHPYDETNTYVDKANGRHCRICRNAAAERSKRKRRHPPLP